MEKHLRMNRKLIILKKRYKYSTSYYRKVKYYKEHGFPTTNIVTSANTEYDSNTNAGFEALPTTTSLRAEQRFVLNLNTKTNSSDSYEHNANNQYDNDASNNLSDIDDDIESDEISISEELRTWALQNQITHVAINRLLGVLINRGIKNLPRDSRTLLQTPRTADITAMGSGEYWYNGIEKCLLNTFHDLSESISIYLNFNIDGLPISRSSKLQLWPILMNLANMPRISPMTIGIYCGDSKPPTVEIYLRQFVDELNILIKNGLKINNCVISITINAFICDSPARCFLKCITNFNAYNGCQKCITTGEFYQEGRHMSFPRVDEDLRTDLDFRNKKYAEHHKTKIITVEKIQNGELIKCKAIEFLKSPLEDLPIDLIKCFVVADSLHLIDLGIVKRCLVGWIHGSFNFKTKFFSAQITAISEWLEKSNAYIPIEIHRAVRRLDCVSFWKASEFRTFVLYLGPIILKHFLSYEVYNHFLLLACAITICSSKSHIKNNLLPLARQLFLDYIEDYIDIYGVDSINSNVHNLCHLVNDVEHFGALYNISAYPFENKLGHIKSLLRNGNKPLAQVANRMCELEKMNNHCGSTKIYPFVKHKIHENINSLTSGDKYRTVHLVDGIILSTNKKNQWFLTKNDSIVKMLYAIIRDHKIFICGTGIKTRNHYFDNPIPSNVLHIFSSTCTHFNEPQLYPLFEIKCKMICLPDKTQFAFIPLLHTLDLLMKFKY